jgi:hypothetical protein
VFAFPLQIGAARLGVLDVFRDRAGALTTTSYGTRCCSPTPPSPRCSISTNTPTV